MKSGAKIFCAIFLTFGPFAATQSEAAAIAYTFTGHLTTVAQSGGGASASSFGTIPVGSTVVVSLVFYEQQSYATSRTYYYRTVEVRMGSEVLTSGPFNNYADGSIGMGLGNPGASFVLTDGGSSDSFALGTGSGVVMSGALGGLNVSGFVRDGISLSANFDPSAISSTDPFGLNMDPSDFISGQMFIPQRGYGDATFVSPTPGFYRMGITLDSVTVAVVPEPAVSTTMILSAAGGCLLSRRRRG